MKNQYRFFANETLALNKKISGNKELSHQILNVLRLHTGDKICLFDLNEREFICHIYVEGKEVFIHVDEEVFEDFSPKYDLTMVISLPKKDKIEMVLQKCTEIGVRSFVVIPSDNSVAKMDLEQFNKKLPRWESIVKEAAEQSGGLFIPKITFCTDFQSFASSGYDRKIYAHKCESSGSLGDIIEKADSKILMAIGPEGGFSKEEIDIFERSDFCSCILGSRILRAETAAIAAASLVLL